MEFGLMTEPQVGGTFASHVRLARWCEANDVAVFARSDHYLNGSTSAHATDAFAALAGLARETDDVLLCVLVSPITFRHPAVVAKAAATIDELSDGRFVLGVGTGWMEEEHDAFGLDLPPLGERFDRFEEALRYLRAAFGRTTGGVDGEHYRLADIEVLPRPARLPIVVGGGGPRKTPSLAGRYADEYNQFSVGRDALEERLAVFREAAREAGRDPDDILVSFVTQAYVGRDDAEYRRVLGEAAAARGLPPEEFEERLASRRMLHGTPSQVDETIAELAEQGVGRIYLQFFRSLDDIESPELDRIIAVVAG